ncbi:MAG: hypothetical protein V2A58_06160 [Planctomycetota bacterium]
MSGRGRMARALAIAALWVVGRVWAGEADPAPTWSADGFHIAFKRGDSIYLADSDALNAKVVYRAGEGEEVSPPRWSPAGSRILVAVCGTGEAGATTPYTLVLIDTETGEISEQVAGEVERETTLSGEGAQWLAKGALIAFVTKAGGTHLLNVRSAEGGEERRAAAAEGICAFSASSGSDRIAYGIASAADRGRVILVNASDGAEEVLWEMRPARGFGEGRRSLVWSPDGQSLAAVVVAPGGAAAGETDFVRRIVVWDARDGRRREVFSSRSSAEVLWREGGQGLWVLTCESRSRATGGRSAVLREVSLDGGSRILADGDIAGLAEGSSALASMAYVLRDEGEAKEQPGYKLVALFGGVTPVEITSHAVGAAWSPRGNKIAFRTSARTLGGAPVQAVGFAFVPSSRVEYLTFSFEENVWRADQFYRNHNHGDALRVYERLLSSVAERNRTALEVRIWLARIRTAGGTAEAGSDALFARLVAQPGECSEATEAFTALGESEMGIVFFGRFRQASEGMHPRAAMHAQFALFDLYWRAGLFDLAEGVMTTKIIPNYRGILSEIKSRRTPAPYEPGVVKRIAQLMETSADRGALAAADPVGLLSEIQGVYDPAIAGPEVREAVELKARIYATRGEKSKALKVWIDLLAGAGNRAERERLWGKVLDLELEAEAP